jgi:hypothetical protein
MLLSWFHVYVVDDTEPELKGALGFHDGQTHSGEGILFLRKCNESLWFNGFTLGIIRRASEPAFGAIC